MKNQIKAAAEESARLALRLLAFPLAVYVALCALTTYHAFHAPDIRVLGPPLLEIDLIPGIGAIALLLFAAWGLRTWPTVAKMVVATACLGAISIFTPIYSGHRVFQWIHVLWGTGFERQFLIQVGALILCSFMALMIYLRVRPHDKKMHGSSRFASGAELRNAGFASDTGIFFGRLRGLDVRSNRGDHVLGLMPTGAGKTSCFVIPTVLETTEHSMVISDVKGAEIFQATAGHRAETHDIYRFEPTADQTNPEGAQKRLAPTACWNPLDEIPRGAGDIAALQRQAADFIVPSKQGSETHWHRAARELFVLLALEVIYNRTHEPSFAAIRRLIGSVQPSEGEGGAGLHDLFTSIASSVHDSELQLGWRDPRHGGATDQHPEIVSLAHRFAKTEARELSSIVSTLSTFLQPWADESVANATKRSDFNLEQFTPESDDERPSLLYVVVPRSDLTRLAPLLRILYSGLASRVASSSRHVDWNARNGLTGRRTLIVLDEFPTLGYMPVFGEMLATLRGYGATLMILAQDLAQIRNIYGLNEPITGGCPIFLAAGSQRPETLRHISALAGESTVTWDRTSHSTAAGGFFGKRSRSRSQAEARRPLLTTGEVRTLDDRHALLFARGLHPVRVEKAPYFRDRALREAADVPPPSSPIPTKEPSA